MKKIKASLLVILAVVAIAFTSCKGGGEPPVVPPTLAELIKGKTYRVSIITVPPSTTPNANFSGFTIAFNAAGTGATLNCNCDPTTGGIFTNTAVTYSAGTNTITFTGTMPSGWPSTLSNVSAGTTGSTLNFNATIGLTNKPEIVYAFALVTP
ncbi:MAG: hypothetical protein EAZ31_04825 [Cytophagia bacterium]|nr:MAG: hypothetical protein EAZ31_04825 [Cytophagia bacterium]